MARACVMCGKTLKTDHPRALTCSATCRSRKSENRSPLRPVDADGRVIVDAGQGRVFAATLRELVAAGRQESSLAAKLLALAARIDENADTGAALAALVKQHDTTMVDALRGSSFISSPLDELRRRRDFKRESG